MRGHFKLSVGEGSPLVGKNPIGSYAYHADMKGSYGEAWMWNNSGLGTLENNRWYCIEQYVKLNEVGKSNGVFRSWVDGRLAYEKTGLRFRTTPNLKIETLWMDVYHGGTKPAPRDHTVFVDNVVVARSYIGPMRK